MRDGGFAPARVLVCVALLVGLGACQTVEPSASTGPAVGPSATAPGYRIAADDTLEVAVFQVPNLNRTVQVDANGRIDLPLLGPVVARGRTARELQTEIANKLGATYLRSPQVTVTVKEGLAQRFAVDGAVMRPGIYVAKGDTTLLQAIAQAGGPNDVGNVDQVMIVRLVEGGREASNYSLRAIRSGQAVDPPVQGRDAVVVGESATLSTLKFVKEFVGPLVGIARYAIP